MNKTKKISLLLFMLAMLVNVGISAYIYYAKILSDKGLSSGSSCFADGSNIGECLKVQLSSYSSIFGIPLTIYGILFFLVIFTLLLAIFKESGHGWFAETSRKYGKQIRVALMLLFMWGGIFSLWLMYLQFFVIGELCYFCLWIDSITLASSILFLGLFAKQVFD